MLIVDFVGLVCGFRGLTETLEKQSENSRRLWLLPGKFRDKCWKIFPNREMLWILGLQVLGKPNLLRTLGRHCPGPCPNLPCGVFGHRQLQPSRDFLKQGRRPRGKDSPKNSLSTRPDQIKNWTQIRSAEPRDQQSILQGGRKLVYQTRHLGEFRDVSLVRCKKKHANNFSIKGFGASKTLSPEILYRWHRN